MRYAFTIDGWRPAALNELLKGGPYGAARLKRRDREYVWGYSRKAGVPRAKGPRRVSLAIQLPPRQRRWDIDALQKSTLDACVFARILVDDRDLYAEWGGVTYTRGPRLETTIIIEDINNTRGES
jgi:Holliday junction resolvase RusA-like endonuclease